MGNSKCLVLKTEKSRNFINFDVCCGLDSEYCLGILGFCHSQWVEVYIFLRMLLT